MENDKKFCKFCGEIIDKESIVCTKCGRQLKIIKEEVEVKNPKEEPVYDEKSKFYAQSWFMWLMLIFFAPVGIFLMWKFHDEMKKNTKIILTVVFSALFLLFAILNGNKNKANKSYSNSVSGSVSKTTDANNGKAKVEVIDFSTMKENEILAWCKEKNLNCNIKKEYSSTIEKGQFIKQSINATEKVTEGSKITVTISLGKSPTTEQKNALNKAESYARMNMSKQGIYEMLTSEYGEKFDKDSAQYAIDNIECDWNANALAKARFYSDTMKMSKQAVYDQLISEYGEKFTKDEAKYAMDHLGD